MPDDPSLDVTRPAAPGADPVGTSMARWQQAESQLYPLIVSDPDLYELAVSVVVEARDVLREKCTSVAALEAADAGTVLERCPTAPAAREGGFNTTRAFEAACAQRFRELTAADGTAVGPASLG